MGPRFAPSAELSEHGIKASNKLKQSRCNDALLERRKRAVGFPSVFLGFCFFLKSFTGVLQGFYWAVKRKT